MGAKYVARLDWIVKGALLGSLLLLLLLVLHCDRTK
jgi:hypothetical protein